MGSKAIAAVFVSCLMTAFCFIAKAQTTADEEIRIDTDLVEVPVFVSDAAGRPISGLKVTDFEVFEDGKPQKIVSFTTTSDSIEVVLILDTSGSAQSELMLIRKAAESFFANLRSGDRASIIGFRPVSGNGEANAQATVIAGITADRAFLISSLANLESSFGTPFYDAIILAAKKVFSAPANSEFRGRRAIVILSDGVDSVSQNSFEDARKAVQETGSAVYFVRLDTRDFFESGLLGDCSAATRFSSSQLLRYYASIDSEKAERVKNFCQLGEFERLAISKRLYEIADAEMFLLTRETGGRVFPAVSLSAARSALMAAASEAGFRYSLGYYPASERLDGTYRRITVKVRSLPSGAKITAREGYFADVAKQRK